MKTINSREMIIRTSDGMTIHGSINLNAELKNLDRLSDFLTHGTNKFITVFNARMMVNMEGTIVINKRHIIWAIPVEDGQEIDINNLSLLEKRKS